MRALLQRPFFQQPGVFTMQVEERPRTTKVDAMRLLITWLINAVALMALPFLMSSVVVTNFTTALIAALVLGLVNTLIRPILVLLTLPVTVVSLGLFILVINAFLFWMVSHWIEGFEVAGFWSAFLAAILYSIISWALSTLLLKDNDGNS